MDDKILAKMWIVIMAIVAITTIVTFSVVSVQNRLDNADDNNTARDRIAACVQSNDVVGCLNAAGRR